MAEGKWVNASANVSPHEYRPNYSKYQLTLVRWHWDLCVAWQVLRHHTMKASPNRMVVINLSQPIWPKNSSTRIAHRISWMCASIPRCALCNEAWINSGSASKPYINYLIMDWWYVCLFILLHNYVGITAQRCRPRVRCRTRFFPSLCYFFFLFKPEKHCRPDFCADAF